MYSALAPSAPSVPLPAEQYSRYIIKTMTSMMATGGINEFLAMMVTRLQTSYMERNWNCTKYYCLHRSWRLRL